MFIGNMFLTVVTGILCKIFRVGDHAYLSFITYYIHLVRVFYLLAYVSSNEIWSYLLPSCSYDLFQIFRQE
ncbi:MAG: hypothetical protein CM1200mP30_18140 [Pseudomonadota bacterium]|nr:MAG: hypothetical protein CM1200mP30_18140 [Pseudomonadota bacterium]